MPITCHDAIARIMFGPSSVVESLGWLRRWKPVAHNLLWDTTMFMYIEVWVCVSVHAYVIYKLVFQQHYQTKILQHDDKHLNHTLEILYHVATRIAIKLLEMTLLFKKKTCRQRRTSTLYPGEANWVVMQIIWTHEESHKRMKMGQLSITALIKLSQWAWVSDLIFFVCDYLHT